MVFVFMATGSHSRFIVKVKYVELDIVDKQHITFFINNDIEVRVDLVIDWTTIDTDVVAKDGVLIGYTGAVPVYLTSKGLMVGGPDEVNTLYKGIYYVDDRDIDH